MGNTTTANRPIHDKLMYTTFTSPSLGISYLPSRAIGKLKRGRACGFRDGVLNLSAFKDGKRHEEIEDFMVPELCDWLIAVEGKLRVLILSSNKLSSKGAKRLLNTLKNMNSSIEYIDLSGNRIDDSCIDCIGDYIQCNESCAGIALNNNSITDRGLQTLSKYLVVSYSSISLYLDANRGITNKSASLLAYLAKRSCTSIISVNDTSISEQNIRAIERMFQVPVEDRVIPIESNSKSAAKRT